MAVFRIEKNSDFTIMPNYPFRDMRLSFKGRGLLGTMLTLRDDWDYTLAGLTAISPHGKSFVAQLVVGWLLTLLLQNREYEHDKSP